MKEKIKALAKKLNAIILAHNYQPPEIQDIADMCGDSLELSIKASKTKSDIIVFCGVRFMAETAYILSPHKVVLLPRSDASCPMVNMINPDNLLNYMKKFDIPIVTYVNSSAEIKAMSSICCTSANVVNVVNSLNEKEILMIPDQNLAKNTSKLTSKKIHTWDGYCPVHNKLKVSEIILLKKEKPNALFIAHPECSPEVTSMADAVLSTSGMMRYVRESKSKEFIIGTEIGLIYPLKKENPNKEFFPAAKHMVCRDMKIITLNDVLSCLENRTEKIKVSEHIRVSASIALWKMINLKTKK